MALVTTAGSATADSYVSLVEATAYASAMGLAWTGSDTVKEAALRRATQYVDRYYRFRGEKAEATQALQWPRTSASLDGYDLDSDVIPRPVKDAVCELASRGLSGALYADVDASVITEETVGPMTLKYDVRASGQKRFALVDDLLAGLIASRSQIAIVRA